MFMNILHLTYYFLNTFKTNVSRTVGPQNLQVGSCYGNSRLYDMLRLISPKLGQLTTWCLFAPMPSPWQMMQYC